MKKRCSFFLSPTQCVTQSHAQPFCPTAGLCSLSVISVDQSAEGERKIWRAGGLHFNLGRPPVIPRGGSMSWACNAKCWAHPTPLPMWHDRPPFDCRTDVLWCYLREIPDLDKGPSRRGVKFIRINIQETSDLSIWAFHIWKSTVQFKAQILVENLYVPVNHLMLCGV